VKHEAPMACLVSGLRGGNAAWSPVGTCVTWADCCLCVRLKVKLFVGNENGFMLRCIRIFLYSFQIVTALLVLDFSTVPLSLGLSFV
jgi:hypothetical protein